MPTETEPTSFVLDNLVTTIDRDLQQQRSEDSAAFENAFAEAGRQTNGGIRLGTDFAHSGAVVQLSEIPPLFKRERDSLGSRFLALIQLKTEELAADAANLTSPGSEELEILENLSEEIQTILRHSYNLGREHGQKDGDDVYKTIMDGYPALSIIYRGEPYTQQHLAQDDPGIIRVKIRVDTPASRNGKHRFLKNKIFKSLTSIFEDIKVSTKYREKQLCSDHQDGPVTCEIRNRKLQDAHLRLTNTISKVIVALYELGKFDGFDVGQNTAKLAWHQYGCHHDAKIYSPATTLDQFGTAIDLHAQVACECARCIFCIQRDTEQYQSEWPDKYQQARDAIEEVETAVKAAAVSARPNKRMRLTQP